MRHFGARLIYISHGAGYITHCISSVSLQHLDGRLSHCRPVYWLSWYTKGRSVLSEDWRLFAVLRGTYPADVLVLGRLLVMRHTLRGKPALVQRTYLVLQNSPTKNLQQELVLLFPWVRSESLYRLGITTAASGSAISQQHIWNRGTCTSATGVASISSHYVSMSLHTTGLKCRALSGFCTALLGTDTHELPIQHVSDRCKDVIGIISSRFSYTFDRAMSLCMRGWISQSYIPSFLEVYLHVATAS